MSLATEVSLKLVKSGWWGIGQESKINRMNLQKLSLWSKRRLKVYKILFVYIGF